MRNGKHLFTVVLFVGVSTLVFGWESIREIVAVSAETNDKRPITIYAAGRGNPFVNFKDGVDLSLPATNGAAGVTMASADFDSDGIADVVIVGTDGSIQFLKGESPQWRTVENLTTKAVPRDPFRAVQITSTALGIAPDEVFAGDLNADGLPDLLAYKRGTGGFVFASGDGRGNFSAPAAIAVNGSITALTVNEIGRPDGQADVAVAYSGKDGSFVDVYEHPESAFKYGPERFKLEEPATALTVGNLDEDFYADIAVASGNTLTVIHGRGQAYPWHLIPDLGIQRPAAIVATRQMPFAISAMTSGRFGERRGTSLAMLGSDGNVYQLEPTREKMRNDRFTSTLSKKMTRRLMLPSGTQPRNIGIVTEPTIPTPSEVGKQLVAASEITANGMSSFIENAVARDAEKYKKMTTAERERILADANLKKALFNERSKRGYLRSIAGSPSKLANWTIESLTNDSPFAYAAGSGPHAKLQTVNVSSSNLDDIMIVDNVRLQTLSRVKPDGEMRRAEVATFDVEGGVASVVPLRLNLDALSDMVVLGNGSNSPTILLTEPLLTFTVNTLSDGASNCLQPGQDCTLREAIELSNSGGGTNEIDFNITGTLKPMSELPVVRQSVSIYGIVDANGNPLIEISGINLDGQGSDGLKIRTSNSFISGLNINRFTAIYDPKSGSSFGGNGLTIESTTLSPNNGNNVVISCYLGTDPTGSLDVGNGATGLNIFDSDDNEIGSLNPAFKNVISGNGSVQSIGVGISLTAGNGNRFFGNIIGLNSQGTGKLGNSQGMFFTGANNEFGGDAAGAGNTISGNGEPYPLPSEQCFGRGMGIVMAIDIETGSFLTSNNNIRGNRMGTDPSGSLRMGNCWKALSTGPLTQTVIGSITQNGRNTISGNGLDGVNCSEFVAILGEASEGGFCAISGNNIGTDITGTIAIPNDWTNQLSGFVVPTGAVEIENNYSFSNLGAPGGTTPNGPCTGFCNIVSGNNGGFWGAGAFGYGTVAVFNNHVGLNQVGNQAIPNEFPGIASASAIGNTYIGLGVFGQSLGNVITGNGGVNAITTTGAGIGGIFQTYYFQGNYVGTDSSGTFSASPDPMGGNNGTMGVQATSRFGDTLYIGGANNEARNVISGHKGTRFGAGTGVQLYGSTGFIGLYNNLIGLNRSLQPLGNQTNGIHLIGASETRNVQIGGTTETANHIAYNGTTGRNYAGILVNNEAQEIPLRQNIIRDNIGLGIDLNPNGSFFEGDGVTPNDDCDNDIDLGANGLQNFPVLAAPTTNSDGTITVGAILKSKKRESYLIDFYSSATADPSGYGEGQTHIGSTTVTTDGNGFIDFMFATSVSVPAGQVITATATDVFGNTSEFSATAGSSAATFEELIDLVPQTCALAIKVNVSTDQPDENPNDSLCDVDTSNEGLQCSLRAAIQEAEARAGYQRIIFEIPGAGPHTISPATFLPTITQPVDIDATTQAPAIPTPSIHLNGAGSSASTGFAITGVAAYIRGFSITGFSSAGIYGAPGSTPFIESCHIGVMPDGNTAGTPQMGSGVLLVNTQGTMIGGDLAEKVNVISNNVIGVAVQNGSGVRFRNNRIGTDRNATTAIPNTVGVKIENSRSVEFGRRLADYPNVISGNTTVGIELTGTATEQGKFYGNYIGTNLGGTAAIPNGQHGIYVHNGARNNSIGTALQLDSGSSGYNIISGHNSSENSAGVFIDQDAGTNTVAGNRIGVNADATASIPNRKGVVIFADEQNVIENVISGNQDYGILLAKPVGSPNVEVTRNMIRNNLIGTNAQDSTTIGNGQVGIFVQGVVKESRIYENTIGQNASVGLALTRATPNGVGPSYNRIYSNEIGTTNSLTAIPNAIGLVMQGSSYNSVYSNVISSNSTFGMLMGSGYSNAVPIIPESPLGGIEQKLLDEFVASPTRQNGTIIEPTANNNVWDNRIGVDNGGSVDLNNHRVGLWVGEYARNNCIGSCDPGQTQGGSGNTISGHNTGLGIGVFISSLSDNPTPDMKPSGNRFRDNTIGTSRDYTQCVPNRQGIVLYQTGVNSIGEFQNVPGNGNFRHGNIITCNTLYAIFNIAYVDGLNIRGNFIGVVPNFGLNPVLPAGSYGGVRVIVERATTRVRMEDNTLGRITETAIVLDEGGGVPIPQPIGNGPVEPILEVSGNLIGVQPDENGVLQRVPNGTGIAINCASGAYIGDSSGSGKKNIIAGNNGNGIAITGQTKDPEDCDEKGENTVSDTYFGTDTFGTLGLGNGENGLAIIDSSNNHIDENVFGSNDENGIYVEGLGTGNRITRNHIGFVEIPGSGTVLTPNSGNGIELNAAHNVLIGGATFDDNVVTHNLENGVLLTNGSSFNTIGAAGLLAGNAVSFNALAGVRIDETAGANNRVLQNSMLANGGLGIDLGALGNTPNDPNDIDEGPNRGQNYPEIVQNQIVNNELIVTFKIESAPGNSNYGTDGLLIEFFRADGGEGIRFLYSTRYTVADHNGSLAGTKTVNLGDITLIGINGNDRLTATATDADGNTSEFFPPIGPTAAAVEVSGRAVRSDGQGIPRAVLTLTADDGTVRRVMTNGLGNYRFDNVESGRTYVIGVAHKQFEFATPTRVLSVLDSIDDVDFTSLL